MKEQPERRVARGPVVESRVSDSFLAFWKRILMQTLPSRAEIRLLKTAGCLSTVAADSERPAAAAACALSYIYLFIT